MRMNGSSTNSGMGSSPTWRGRDFSAGGKLGSVQDPGGPPDRRAAHATHHRSCADHGRAPTSPSPLPYALLREKKIPFTPHLYPFEEHGGTAHAAASLGVDEHCVIKTLVMQTDDRRTLPRAHARRPGGLDEATGKDRRCEAGGTVRSGHRDTADGLHGRRGQSVRYANATAGLRRTIHSRPSRPVSSTEANAASWWRSHRHHLDGGDHHRSRWTSPSQP